MAPKESYLRFDIVLYLLLGIGSYWAWSTCVTLSSSFWPGATPDRLHIDFLANLLGHAVVLAVLSALAPAMAPFGRRRLCTLVAPGVIALCTMALLLGYALQDTVVLTGLASFASGAAMAVMLFLWAEALLLLKRGDVRRMVLEGSVIAGLVITVIVLCLPMPMGIALSMALPFATAGCCKRAACGLQRHDGPIVDAPSPGNGAEESPGESDPKPTKRRWESLLLCCFVLALPAGMYQGAEAADAGRAADSARMLFACVCVLVTLAVAIDHKLARSPLSNLFTQLIVPIMAGGMLILSVVGSGLENWGAYIMQTGYELFLIYVYTEFARGANGRQHPLRIFGLGTLAIDGGLLAGFSLMSFTSFLHDDWAQGAMLAIVYLLLLVGVLVFPKVVEQVSARTTPIGVADAGSERPGDPRGSAPSQQEAIALFAARYGLSERESEILQNLVRGRTLPSIAEETCLSYNTVKTHVSHIYQKTGVHTRDALLDMLECHEGRR